MAAAVHGNVGRRAAAADRKVVFKSVLENPFNIPWPHVALNIQNTVLAALVAMLGGVAEYHVARQAASRKRKRARHDKARKDKATAKKKRKLGDGSAKDGEDDAGDGDEAAEAGPAGAADVDAIDVDNAADNAADTDEPLPPLPPVFAHLTFGTNEVTKRLEAQCRALRPRISVQPSSSSNSTPPAAADPPPLTHVFVCRADIDPPLLIAHLPALVAACNAPAPASPPLPVLLIPLPANAEQTLADAVGLRRVSVLALDATTPALATLAPFLANIQPPSAPWLTASTTAHVPTHIKQLRTTAPRDMHAAKRARAAGKQAAKEIKEKAPGAHGKGKLRKEKKIIKITASAPAPAKDHPPP